MEDASSGRRLYSPEGTRECIPAEMLETEEVVDDPEKVR